MKNIVQGIYKIINCVNNKVYIGQSIDINQRFYTHKNNALNKDFKHPLYNSIRKYGIENFEFIVLEEVFNADDLDCRESYWIKNYNSSNRSFGYNLVSYCNYGERRKHADVTREKISKTVKELWQDLVYRENNKFTEERRKQLSIKNKGKKHSNKTRQKLSDINKGKKLSGETKQKLSIINTGKKYSDESKLKKSKIMLEKWKDLSYVEKVKNGLKGKICSEETRRKISKANTGKKLSEEVCKKQSEIQKVLWSTEEHRIKVLEARKNVYTNDVKAKMATKAKEKWADPVFKAKMIEIRKKQGELRKQANAQQALDNLKIIKLIPDNNLVQDNLNTGVG